MLKRRTFLGWLALLGITGATALWASPMPGMADARYKVIDASATRLTTAYNAGNAQDFLAEFAPGELQLVDAQARIKNWKTKIGNIKSRTLNAAASHSTEASANMTYEVVTDKGTFQLWLQYSPYQGGPDKVTDASIRTTKGLRIP